MDSTTNQDYVITKSESGAYIRQPKINNQAQNKNIAAGHNNLLETKIKDEFLSKTFTKTQALRRIRVVKDFLNNTLFAQNSQPDFNSQLEQFKKGFFAGLEKDKLASPENLRKYRIKTQDIEFIAQLGESFFKLFTAVNIDNQVKILAKSIESSQTYLIYIPVELPDEEQDRLGKWFKENVSKECLVEFNYDPDLIGGCAISSNGVYKNYSISQKIHDNKDSIIQALTSYKQV